MSLVREMEGSQLPILSTREEPNMLQIAYTIPKARKRRLPELVDINDVLLIPNTSHSTEIIFPSVARGKENIKIRFAWFFDPPGFGKTVKCRGMAEHAYRSGLYKQDKTQVLEGTDLEAMFLKVREGTECVVLILNDAHGKHSSLRMSSHAAEERNDFIFMARHKFREFSKRKNGVIIVIANAQIERSISPWLRTMGDLKCSTSLLSDDDDKKTQVQWFGKAGVRKLKEFFREIKERGNEQVKSKCVCYIVGREEKEKFYDYSNKETTPVGILDIPPLERICLSCGYKERGFFVECPKCGEENYDVPFESKIIEYVPDLTITQRDHVMRQEDYEILDDLIARCRMDGLECKSHFSKILTRRVDHWYQEDPERLKRFEDNRVWFINRVIGELKGTATLEDAAEIPEQDDREVDFSTERFEYDIFEAVDRLTKKYKLKKNMGKVYKMYRDPNNAMSQNEISNKLGIPQSTISKWVSDKGRVGGLIRNDMGDGYELWVKRHLEEGYKVPRVFERDDIEEVIKVGGASHEPDLMIIYQNGDVDVLSLKCYNESGATTIHTQYAGKCDVRPELIAFMELLNNKKFEFKSGREVVVNDENSVRLIVLVRNISYRHFEAVDVVTNPKEMGDKVTFSQSSIDEGIIRQVTWYSPDPPLQESVLEEE